MGYNYHAAFHEPVIDTETIKAASLVAMMNFREEFPHTGYVEVTVIPSRKAIRVQGGHRIRLYTFEELGFKV